MSNLLILSPALRLLPQRAAAVAGRAGWAVALPVFPLLAVYALYLSRLSELQQEGIGMAEYAMLRLGERVGRAVLLLYGAWFLFYGGFLLRAGADRLAAAVYPQASPRPFLLSMGLLCLFAALGKLRSLARFARVILPLLLSVMLLLLLISLKDVQSSNLLPVTILDFPAMLQAGAPALDVLGLGLVLPFFLLPQVERSGPLWPGLLRCLLQQTLLLTLLGLTVIGKFGAELAAQLTLPFFTLVRNLLLFQSFERMEALIVSCWVFPDFLLVSLCLYTAQYCVRTAFGAAPQIDDGPRFSMERMRWVIPLCSLCSMAVGLLLAPDLTSLRRLSDHVIPAMGLIFLLSPILLDLAGRLQKPELPVLRFLHALRRSRRKEQ